MHKAHDLRLASNRLLLCFPARRQCAGFGRQWCGVGTEDGDNDEPGCAGCGSCPLSDNDGANEIGVLKVDYVAESQCVGLCVYQSGRDREPVLAWTPSAGVVAVN